MGNVLVVSTVDHPEDVLRRYVGEGDKLKVVVPVVRQGVLDWLANDQKAFTHAEHVAEDVAAHLPGETVEAKAGEADVDLAIRDALATFRSRRDCRRGAANGSGGKGGIGRDGQRAYEESARHSRPVCRHPGITAALRDAVAKDRVINVAWLSPPTCT